MPFLELIIGIAITWSVFGAVAGPWLGRLAVWLADDAVEAGSYLEWREQKAEYPAG